MTDKAHKNDRQPGEAFAAWIARIGGTVDPDPSMTLTFLSGAAVDVAKKQSGTDKP